MVQDGVGLGDAAAWRSWASHFVAMVLRASLRMTMVKEGSRHLPMLFRANCYSAGSDLTDQPRGGS
jgi:hypothetical protein